MLTIKVTFQHNQDFPSIKYPCLVISISLNLLNFVRILYSYAINDMSINLNIIFLDRMSTQVESQPQNKKNKGKSSQVPAVKAHWDGKANKNFIKLCVEQVRAGHRHGTHLDRIGWEKSDN